MLHALIATAGASWAWASVSCFAAAILSAIFPWIAAEAVLIAFLALAHSSVEVVGVVVILSVGQMAGKAIVFCHGDVLNSIYWTIEFFGTQA